MATWKRDAASGLVVLVPLLLTLFVVYWIYSQIANFGLLGAIDPPALRVALAVVVFVGLVFAVGYLMRTAVGSVAEGYIDDTINRLPGLRVVYNASKMGVETVLSGGTGEFQKPVKVETWDGLRMTAFKTGKSTDDGREIVFIPTSPNITTGFVVEAEPEDIQELDESTEDALTRVLSAGFGEAHDDDVEELVD
ncbi:DUF502 domain-containing protein [Salarchaeum japonicum]|uniref:DUF502 domain-containing protein n=1 Tax=Salarchaeum japonicum TaxID=555573 RepID=A0AAV3SZM8_9EURY|nr:DUF502 domain-containing protein [Salarchaeum japonicum]